VTLRLAGPITTTPQPPPSVREHRQGYSVSAVTDTHVITSRDGCWRQIALAADRSWATRAEACGDPIRWIEGWFNSRRLHSTNNDNSPTDW
jgi:transposase InsO family protein